MIRNRLSHISSTPVLLAALAAALTLGASACSPQDRQTLVPTLAATITLPTATPPATLTAQEVLATAYPGGNQQPEPPAMPSPGAEEAYPSGPGAMGGPVVYNLSRITAQLVEQAPADAETGAVRLRVEVLTSAPVEGYVEYAAGAVGEQIDLLVPAANMPDLSPGDRLRAEVRYEGDERGGAYYAGMVERITP